MADVWVIDTSSIIEVRRPALQIPTPRLAAVYRQLGELVNQGSLVFPRKVLDELERQAGMIAATGSADLPYEWARQNAETATRHGTDYGALREVLAVEGIAQLLDPDKRGVEPADPYVLALAHQLRGLGDFPRVITEDRRDAPDKVALASACGLVGIPVVPTRAFLLNRRIWPSG